MPMPCTTSCAANGIDSSSANYLAPSPIDKQCPLATRRMKARCRAAAAAVPAASRQRFPRRFPACPTASRAACVASSSPPTTAAPSSVDPSGQRCVRACVRNQPCAVHRGSTHWRGCLRSNTLPLRPSQRSSGARRRHDHVQTSNLRDQICKRLSSIHPESGTEKSHQGRGRSNHPVVDGLQSGGFAAANRTGKRF